MRQLHVALRSAEQPERVSAIAPARLSHYREEAVLENLSAHGTAGGIRHEPVATLPPI